MALAVVTIASHRTRTSAILHNSRANDAWAHYQSTRVKYHNLELVENLAGILGAKGEAADRMLADTRQQQKKYDEQGKEIQAEAQHGNSWPKPTNTGRCATTSAKGCWRSPWR